METKWTFDEWMATPPYIQSVMILVVQTRRRAEHEQSERQRREAEAARHGH